MLQIVALIAHYGKIYHQSDKFSCLLIRVAQCSVFFGGSLGVVVQATNEKAVKAKRTFLLILYKLK
jgi:hypothetical protein